jgi:hypothetical protein
MYCQLKRGAVDSAGLVSSSDSGANDMNATSQSTVLVEPPGLRGCWLSNRLGYFRSRGPGSASRSKSSIATECIRAGLAKETSIPPRRWVCAGARVEAHRLQEDDCAVIYQTGLRSPSALWHPAPRVAGPDVTASTIPCRRPTRNRARVVVREHTGKPAAKKRSRVFDKASRSLRVELHRRGDDGAYQFTLSWVAWPHRDHRVVVV